MHTMWIEGDRRSTDRVWMAEPCKVYDPRSQRYLAGATRNISESGMLIDLPRVLEIKPGEAVHVGVACKRRQHLIKAAQMVKATVVRIIHTVDDHTLLGLKFEQADDAISREMLRLAA